MPQPIFFAHANGFPSATYGKLFDALAPDYQVRHLTQHGHDPRFPVDDNWIGLVDELIHHLQTGGEPVWGVGHSLGGLLHYHAALRRPELYLGVVLLDSPLLTWADRLLIRTAKRLGFIDRITPAARTLGRRIDFADTAEARDYFAGKRLFHHFDPDCLQAYVSHGLQATDQGLRLRFDPATEIGIYRSVPHHVPGRPAELAVPLALLRGQHSRVVLPHHTRLLRQVPRAEYHQIPGGHMFPLERPQDTATHLRQLLGRWADSHEECA